jgi:hypothetical protein
MLILWIPEISRLAKSNPTYFVLLVSYSPTELNALEMLIEPYEYGIIAPAPGDFKGASGVGNYGYVNDSLGQSVNTYRLKPHG